MHDGGQRNPVAVLFSGGVDSMILAAILHECLDAMCRFFIFLRSMSLKYSAFVC